ncbi:MAG: FtsH protease activity modulator HflK [Proteobacteria bacterium]|nr:FtsH protease activity modulator HflK [Pseudomonadota bacterium]
MPWSNQGGGSGGGSGGGDGWQGGGGGQSPWGRGSGGPQPPDIEELLRKGQDRMKSFLPGGFGGGRGAALIISLASVVWLGSGFYQVAPDEQGVELIFGKWSPTTGVTQPGLNYNWPSPIGEVFKPKVTHVNRIEIGFRSGTEGNRGSSLQRQVPSESLMLTGDENIIDVNFVVLWVINDAGKYLFNIRDAAQSIRDVAESAMREVIGKTNADHARAEGRLEVEVKTRELLQKTLDEYGAGVLITQLQLQKVDPPEAVIDAFRDVQRARADRERAINDAQGYANSVIPQARGEAAHLLEEANAYKAEVVARSQGDAERFLAVYDAYKTGRAVTVKRIYLETMEEILKGMNKIIIDSKGASQGVLPYLPLGELQRSTKGGG